MKGGVLEAIRAAGGEVYGISSEPQHLADQARRHWGLEFETVGDPHHEISRVCSERGWLTLFAQDSIEFLQRGTTWDVEHPKGFFQPGVLALTQQGRVLYRWRSVPSSKNLAGTLSRPTANYVREKIEQALRDGTAVGDAAHDDDPEIDQKPVPQLLFVGLVLANGWFVTPRAFAYSPGAPAPQKRIAIAAARLALFVLAWLAAAVWLPGVPVAIAFAAWGAWIARELRRTIVPLRRSRELTSDS